MPIYGRLMAESPEAYAAEVAREAKSGVGIYGILMSNEPLPAPAAPAKAPEVIPTAIGIDYTVEGLQQAVKVDPVLAETLALTEVARPQGMRKSALQFLATQPLSEKTASLVTVALATFSGK